MSNVLHNTPAKKLHQTLTMIYPSIIYPWFKGHLFFPEFSGFHCIKVKTGIDYRTISTKPGKNTDCQFRKYFNKYIIIISPQTIKRWIKSKKRKKTKFINFPTDNWKTKILDVYTEDVWSCIKGFQKKLQFNLFNTIHSLVSDLKKCDSCEFQGGLRPPFHGLGRVHCPLTPPGYAFEVI